MATAAQQARYRARDAKRTVEVRLDPAALSRLDKLVARLGAPGRGAAVERLVLAAPGEHPGVLANEAARLARAYFMSTGENEVALRDAEGWRFVIRREGL